MQGVEQKFKRTRSSMWQKPTWKGVLQAFSETLKIKNPIYRNILKKVILSWVNPFYIVKILDL